MRIPMRKATFAASVLLLAAAFVLPRLIDFSTPRAGAADPAATAGAAMARSADALLDSLDADARSKASFAYGDAERINWHFVPREANRRSTRKGLPLSAMSKASRERVNGLLKAGLSSIGYETVHTVRELEGILAQIEGPNRRFSRDPESYFVSVFGTPGGKGSWGWRLEGHHLCLNFTLDGGRLVSATPVVLGANPAIVRSGPRKGLRALAGTEDRARELMASLDERQLARARGQGQPEELKGMTKAAYDADLPAGLPVAALTPEQREIFTRLVREYTKHHEDGTRKRGEKTILGADPKQVQLAWRGSLKPYEGHSYIVHGPGFVISYANFQNGAAHVHSALRYTDGEFGLRKPDKKP